MKNDIKILKIIIDYCNEIIDDVDYFGDDEETYLEIRRYQRSTSFCIIQIGEMTKRLSLELRSKYPDLDWKGISGTRDVVVHNYEYIRLKSMWETIQEEIPELKDRCEAIIEELEKESNSDK